MKKTNHKEIIRWAYDYLSSHGYIPTVFRNATRRSENERAECTSEYMSTRVKLQQSGILKDEGYALKSHLPEEVQKTPWSYVIRFATSEGYIYLKHTPEMLALEARIIQVFRDQFQASVPQIIANNAELNCFLMKDAGKSLRIILKQKFDEELLCRAIDQFTALQLVVADRVDVFLNIGVPDWRLDKLSDLYQQLLSQKGMLMADGLSEIEITKLEALIPKISRERARNNFRNFII